MPSLKLTLRVLREDALLCLSSGRLLSAAGVWGVLLEDEDELWRIECGGGRVALEGVMALALEVFMGDTGERTFSELRP